MIIALETGNPIEAADYAKAVAEHLDGTTKIYNPQSFDEYAEAVKTYKPSRKTHLILLSSHYSLLRVDSTHPQWRMTDLLLNNRGGQVWGTEPVWENETYGGELLDDPSRLAYIASYNNERALLTAKVSKQILGRSLSDPHTLFVGYRFSPPRLSNGNKLLIGSLPDDWWRGAAFLALPTEAVITRAADWFSETNIVALGQNAHDLLESLNISHGAAPQPAATGVYNKKTVFPPYGRMLREVARTQENNLSWTP